MSDDRLDGWKEISRYLKRDVRTCQRWEKEFGLPVHRIDDQSQRSKVFSHRSEIDEWFRTQLSQQEKAKEVFGRQKALILSLAAFLIILASLVLVLYWNKIWLFSPSGAEMNPIRWEVRGNNLVFFDISDRLLWGLEIQSTKSLEDFYYRKGLDSRNKKNTRILLRNKVVLTDIDRDGKNEVIAFLRQDRPQDRSVVLCDNDGQRLWARTLDYEQEYESGKIPLDFFVHQIECQDIDTDGDKEVLVLWNHVKRFPSVFMIYDIRGKEKLRYSHTGLLQIFICQQQADGKARIYIGGTNNLLDGEGVLAVLDAHRLRSGLAPPYSIPRDLKDKEQDLWIYVPKNYKAADQLYYLRFGHNEFSRALGVKWLNPLKIQPGREAVDIQVFYDLAFNCGVLFSFDPGFRLRYVVPGADLQRKYQTLLSEGKVRIPFYRFQARLRHSIRFWNRQGWSETPPFSSARMENQRIRRSDN